MPLTSFPSPRSRRVRPAIALATCLALGAAGFGLALPAAAAPSTPTTSPAAAGSPRTVTLVTGDAVTITPLSDGTNTVDIASARPGDGIRTYRTGDELHVVPDAALPFLASGALDPDLFNVSLLLDYGYDDATVAGTPVIVEYANARAFSDLPGLEIAATLPSISGAAGDIARDSAAATWSALTASTPQARAAVGGLGGGIAALHLDGKVKATLDGSVPWIHAPEAWAEGFTGDGVTVAVLDTGYDDAHPDLAGHVLPDSTSFVPGEDVATDTQGHGTHVASTIAGTGAASDGTHRGVADGADLLVGKVLDANGYGQDSWIIAGMEWAGERADIVSMSLGSQEASDGTDVMAMALDDISERTGALFVVAAGNSTAPETIGSPGSAARALTVGSVDDPSGALSWFSSQGPLFRSGAMKPDIAGPGNEVTAARSADSPGEGSYITMSGTSMATPHVAGAAAIVKQRHPEFTADQLRAALMSSTVDTGLTPYQYGAGVVDVARAVDATVVASGSGDFGMLVWGEDASTVTRDVTYANTGDADVTLVLEAGLTDTTPGGEGGAADDALSLSADELEIAAGATATVTVSVDQTKIPVGAQLSGALVASIDGDPVARTALGALVEAERYDLTVTATDFEGEASDTYAMLFNLDTGDAGIIAVAGETTLRLPEAMYSVMAWSTLARTPDTSADVLTGDPDIVLDRDSSVSLDARTARQLTVDVGDKSVDAAYRRVDFTVNDIAGSSTVPVTVDELWAQPMTAPNAEFFDFTARWRLQTPFLTVSANGAPLDVIPQVGSPLLDGKLSKKSVNAGSGTAEEFAAVKAKGKVAVVTATPDLTVGAQAANAAAAGAVLLVVANSEDGELSTWAGNDDGTDSAIPVAGISGVEGRALLAGMKKKQVTIAAVGTPASSVVYDIAMYRDGSIPEDLAYAPSKLAKIDTRFLGEKRLVGEFRYDFVPSTMFGTGYPMRTSSGMSRTDWVNTDSVSWYQGASVVDTTWEVRDVKRSYKPGEKTTAEWFGPIVRPFVGDGYWAPFRDSWGGAQINVPSWSDGGSAQHTGAFDTYAGLPGISQTSELYIDGELRASSEYQGLNLWDAPTGVADWRIVNTAVQDAAFLKSSTRTVTEWGFRSDAPTEEGATEILPMIQAWYDVDVDAKSRVGAGRWLIEPVEVGLELSHVAGAVGTGKITKATFETRAAGGAFKPALLFKDTASAAGTRTHVAGYGAYFWPSTKGGWIDVRVTATDAAGNTFSQVIERAFEVAPAKSFGWGGR